MASVPASPCLLYTSIDRAEINKNIHIDRPLIGDAKVVLEKLLPQIAPQQHPDWQARIAKEKVEPQKTVEGLEPFEILQTIEKLTDGEATIVTDVGQHQMLSLIHI